MNDDNIFVPVLTVLPKYYYAPFLWLRDSKDMNGVGNLLAVAGVGWVESFPLSEGLWGKFADWAEEFESTRFLASDFKAYWWDWDEFHARGLQISRWLKEEVGEAFRVVYCKPCEDRNHLIEPCLEILADGELKQLPAVGSHHFKGLGYKGCDIP